MAKDRITLEPLEIREAHLLEEGDNTSRHNSSSFLSESIKRIDKAIMARESVGTPPSEVKKFGIPRINISHEQEAEYKIILKWIILLVNFLALVFIFYRADWKFESFKINPSLGPSINVLVDNGAKVASKIVNDGEWWRLFVPMFLHAGILHFLLNMIMLDQLGTTFERDFGMFRFATVYFSAGFAGIIASALFVPELVGVGASGSLYGLIGASFADFIQNYKLLQGNKTCYAINLVFSTAFGLAFGLLPYVDNFAHLGGFVAGFLAACAVISNNGYDEKGKSMRPWYYLIVKFGGAVALIVLLMVGLILLYTRADFSGCKTCQLFECVQTKYWSCSLAPRKQICILDNPDGTSEEVNCDDYTTAPPM